MKLVTNQKRRDEMQKINDGKQINNKGDAQRDNNRVVCVTWNNHHQHPKADVGWAERRYNKK